MWEVSLTLFQAEPFQPFWAHRSLRSLRHGGDPLDAPDGLGLQSRTTPCADLFRGRPQTDVLLIHPASVSVARAFGTARPPLRDPTALDDVIARKALVKCKRGLKDLKKGVHPVLAYSPVAQNFVFHIHIFLLEMA